MEFFGHFTNIIELLVGVRLLETTGKGKLIVKIKEKYYGAFTRMVNNK